MLVQDIKREHRIVVFRALKLGDMLCALPSLETLRNAFPKSFISLICHPSMTSLFERFPHLIDDLIPFPGFPGMPEKEFEPSEVISFLASIQSCKFDMAIQLHGSGQISNILLSLIGAEVNYGFHSEDSFKVEDTFIPYPHYLHESLRCQQLIDFITGKPNELPSIDFPILEDDIEELNGFGLEPDEPFFCLHPGASTFTKRWPAENFSLIADHICAQGFRVVFTGSKAESDLVSTIRSMMKYESIDAASAYLSIGALAQLINLSSGLICNDTGVSHLSALLKKRSLVLFSETDPSRWAPLNSELHPWLLRPSVDEVITKIDSFLLAHPVIL